MYVKGGVSMAKMGKDASLIGGVAYEHGNNQKSMRDYMEMT
jgi:hypothetical protein